MSALPKLQPEEKCCKTCGTKVRRKSKTLLCMKCAAKERCKKYPPNMIGIHNFGEKASRYIDGRSLGKRYCVDCNKLLNKVAAFNNTQRCKACAQKNYFKNPKNNPFYGIHRFGEENPNYKQNKESRPYPLGWNKTFKEQIRNRDGYKCQNCGVHEVDCIYKLHVHHIDYNKTNLLSNNLISLCHNCHAKTTVTKLDKRRFFIDYYQRKMYVGSAKT